jgi:hypothetical protein
MIVSSAFGTILPPHRHRGNDVSCARELTVAKKDPGEATPG